MRQQQVPVGLTVKGRQSELNEHLTEHLAAAVAVIVEEGALERPRFHLRPTEASVEEGGVPHRLIAVDDRFGAATGLLAAPEFWVDLKKGVKIKCISCWVNDNEFTMVI